MCLLRKLSDLCGGQVHRYRDASSDAYWQTGGIYEGSVIMDRNLGAVGADFAGHGSVSDDTTFTNVGSQYYQFGRKDPFPRSLGRYLENTTSTAQSFAYSVNNPSTYIGVGNSNNWNTDTAGETTYLWQDRTLQKSTDGKSIFDPSPLGWKVSTHMIWTDLTSSTITRDFTINYGATYTTNSINAYYPANGSRSPMTGELLNGGNNIYSNTSTPSTASQRYVLLFSASLIYSGNASFSRSNGFPVRAIRD